MRERSWRRERGHSESSTELIDFSSEFVVLLNEGSFSHLRQKGDNESK